VPRGKSRDATRASPFPSTNHGVTALHGLPWVDIKPPTGDRAKDSEDHHGVLRVIDMEMVKKNRPKEF